MTHYVGIPYLNHGRTREGLDCWGLVYLHHLDRGLNLPSLSSEYPDATGRDRDLISLLIRDNIGLFQSVDEARRGDVILFNFMGSPSHISICDGGTWMLNADALIGVHREQFNTPRWQSRFIGFYRFNEAA